MLPCPVLPSLALPRPALPRPAPPCPALPRPAPPCPALVLQPGPHVACGKVAKGGFIQSHIMLRFIRRSTAFAAASRLYIALLKASVHSNWQCECLLQAFQLWLQYTTLLGSVNVDLPKTVRWIPSAASFAFSSVTSGALSTDCLLDPASTSMALQRLLLRLAVLPLVLLLLAALQVVW